MVFGQSSTLVPDVKPETAPAGPPDKPVITLRNLSRKFGDQVAVDNLTLDIRQGEVFGLLGHNGAGKTTTVRLLNGVLTPSSGKATVLGYDPSREGVALRKRTGVSTETPSLDDKLSAQVSLEIVAELYDVPPSQVKTRIRRLLKRFNLTDAASLKVGGYSKGMKQRLALARALLHEPELLFLDEPTSGLDPVASKQVNDLIRHLSRDEGKTVVLCTHNLAQAQELCHRVAVLEHGRLVALGTPRDLARQLGRGQRLLLEPSATTFEQARRLLAVHPAVSSLNHTEVKGSLTFAVPDREDVPNLITLLVEKNVQLYRVELENTSLEDVYFALHHQQEVAG